ncbi:MAG: hypothetical protein V3V04_01565 [Rhizobiaceae bacterium]
MPLQTNGFIGLLTSFGEFEIAFRKRTIRNYALYGVFPVFDDVALKDTWDIWRGVSWGADSDESVPFTDVSHIKWAGSLLWAFTQREAVPECVKITDENRIVLAKMGLTDVVRELDKSKGKTFQTFPTQSNAFIFVTAVFNAVQRGRLDAGEVSKRDGIDVLKSPLTSHYFRNFCRYLLVDAPSVESLYMHYKTIDLYGVKLPGSK